MIPVKAVNVKLGVLLKSYIPTLLLLLMPVLPFSVVFDPGSESGDAPWRNAYITDNMEDLFIFGPLYLGWLLYLLLPGRRTKLVVMILLLAATGYFSAMVLVGGGMAAQDVEPHIGSLLATLIFPSFVLTAYFRFGKAKT